jgi:hypothetical protein
MNKKIFYLNFILIFTFVLLFSINNFSFASSSTTPKLVSIIDSAFKQIESWLLMISTPAAAVAVGTGIFMKKFSFGDEQRISTGKKIIRGSLFSYAFILAIDLILSAIQSLIS